MRKKRGVLIDVLQGLSGMRHVSKRDVHVPEVARRVLSHRKVAIAVQHLKFHEPKNIGNGCDSIFGTDGRSPWLDLKRAQCFWRVIPKPAPLPCPVLAKDLVLGRSEG